jgi:hypothetical protein
MLTCSEPVNHGDLWVACGKQLSRGSWVFSSQLSVPDDQFYR